MDLVQIEAPRPRLPGWARRPRTHHASLHQLKSGFRSLGLHTVCESARCPNIHECFHRGAATFMILGNLCTRSCGFCAVPRGRPQPLDPHEPANVARMAAQMRLRYVVITSVNRDELRDGGSAHFAATVAEVKRALPEARVEVLTPDFCGALEAVARILEAGPHVFNHNVETVPRLYRRVRPQAKYEQSLQVLAFARRHSPAVSLEPTLPSAAGLSHFGPRSPAELAGSGIVSPAMLTKSGFMVGLGERSEEVEQLLNDLRQAAVDVVTIGQYLQPTRRHLPVEQFVPPETFDRYRDHGLRLGFRAVFSAPLVRSSYMADLVATEAQ